MQIKKAIFLLFLFFVGFGVIYAQRRVIIPLVDGQTGKPALLDKRCIFWVMNEDSVAMPDAKSVSVTKSNSAGTKTFVEFYVPKHGQYILSMYSSRYRHVEYNFEIKKSDKRKEIEFEALSLEPLVLTEEEELMLSEATVTAPRVKFYFDNDTLVYNANAFLHTSGSMLSNLLQKMPGLEIKADGEVFCNGRRVDVLLLNGKDFFNEDRITLLANLPAYAVQQVKVYDAKENSLENATRVRAVSGHVMDIILKPDFQSASFGNVDLGGGTGNRYYAKFLGMRYGTHYRLSGYAMSNNINRYDNLQLDGTAQLIDDYGGGEKQHHRIGMNYNYDDYKSRFWLRGSAQLFWAENDFDAQQTMQRFLPSGDVFNVSKELLLSRNFSFNTHHELNLFSKTAYGFVVRTQLNLVRDKSQRHNFSATTMADATSFSTNWLDSIRATPFSSFFQLYGVNRLQSQQKNQGESTTFRIDLTKSRFSLSEDHHLSARAIWEFDTRKNRDYLQNQVDYVATPTANTWQNQFKRQTSTHHNLEGSLDYTMDINVRSCFLANYRAGYVYYDTNHSLFALDALNGWKREDAPQLGLLPSQLEMFSAMDLQNSYEYTEHQHRHQLSLGYNLTLKGGELKVMLPLNIERKRLDFSQSGHLERVERSFFMPEVDVNLNFFMKNKYLKFSYRLQQQSPTLYNLINIVNTSDLLLVKEGNPDLKTAQSHAFNAYYYFSKGMGYHNWSVYSNWQVNSIAQSSTYDKETGRTIIKPRNVDGNYSLGINLKDRLSLNNQASSSIENDISFDFARSVDYISLVTQSEASRSKVQNRTIKENLTYAQSLFHQHLRISLTAYCHYNRYTSAREGFETVNSFDFGGKFVLNADLPWEISLSTDLTTVSRRGYNYADMNDDEYIWNARLTKAFGERVQIQFEVSDILAQRKTVYHVLNAQSRMESFFNGLRRFGMVHFIWRLGKSPNKTPSYIHS